MTIKKYSELILTKIRSLFEKIMLTVLYFVGIGITSLIARFLGKSFLNMQVKKTTWEKPSGSRNLETMY